MMRPSTTLALAAACLLASARPMAAGAQDRAPLEVLYGFTLVDGTGAPPLPDAAIAVRGQEIVAVASRLALLTGPDALRDAIATDLGGGYVVPGLIDAHVHLATVPNRPHAEAELHRMLYAGITAVRDMAGDGRALASLARDSRLGRIPAPDVYFAALMAGPSFLSDPRPQSSAAGEVAGEVPWMQSITPETDLVTAVARAKGTYASGIKIYANLEPELVAGITREAHRQGMRVWAHSMVFPTRPLEVVRSDVDVVSHVCRLAWEAMAEAPTRYHHDQTPLYANFTVDSPVFTELLGEMRERGTLLDATLAMYAHAGEEEDPDNPLSDRCDIGFARSFVRRAAAFGVPIVAGTDFTAEPGAAFPALHDELEELVRGGGLTPMQALESATRVAAEAIGASDRHGVLAPGRPVTFVHVAADPLDDISNLRTVRAVWKNGQRYDRNRYRPLITDDSEEAPPPTTGPASVQEVLDGWQSAWRRYDLDTLDEVLLHDASLTYFAQDESRLLEGFDAVRAHHERLGFVPGGARPQWALWLEEVLITHFDDTAVISAVWRLGNPVLGSDAASGPLTMVVTRTRSGYRIAHVNMTGGPLDP